MTRLEKIQLAIKKGITCDINTGKVYGVRGNELISVTNSTGYKYIGLVLNKKLYYLQQHHFIYYMATNNVVDEIDHIDGNRLNNSIDNLRSVTRKQNGYNKKKSKGYYFFNGKYHAQIGVDNKTIYLGLFDNELQASQAYSDAKKIYHII